MKTGSRETRWVVAILVAGLVSLAWGCGDDDDGGDKGEEPNQMEPNQSEGEWEELDESRGWMEKREEEMGGEGAFIEESHAGLGDSCEASLEAAEDGPGLGWVTVVPQENVGANAGANDGLNDGLGAPSIEERLATRPDLEVEPAPIFNASLSNARAKATDEYEGYERLIEVSAAGGLTPVRYSDCRTVYERGACYVPSDEFGGDGCSIVPESRLSTQRGVSELEMSDGDGHFSYQRGSLCDDWNEVVGEDDVMENPEILEDLGVQEIRLVGFEDWQEGELRELSADDLEWSASYTASRDCQDLRNPGPMCNCVWDVKDVEEFERAWALPMEDKVYVELKGSGDDEEFYFWGGIER